MKTDMRGYTLVEAMIGILLTAFVVVSVFAVSLAAKRSIGKYERRVAARNAGLALLRQLGNYVSAYYFDSSTGYLGPNQQCSAASCGGLGSWTLPTPLDDCGGCANALATGAHDATVLLPTLLQTGYGMTMNYTVTDENSQACPGVPEGCARLKVFVQINWVEPP